MFLKYCFNIFCLKIRLFLDIIAKSQDEIYFYIFISKWQDADIFTCHLKKTYIFFFYILKCYLQVLTFYLKSNKHWQMYSSFRNNLSEYLMKNLVKWLVNHLPPILFQISSWSRNRIWRLWSLSPPKTFMRLLRIVWFPHFLLCSLIIYLMTFAYSYLSL